MGISELWDKYKESTDLDFFNYSVEKYGIDNVDFLLSNSEFQTEIKKTISYQAYKFQLATQRFLRNIYNALLP